MVKFRPAIVLFTVTIIETILYSVRFTWRHSKLIMSTPETFSTRHSLAGVDNDVWLLEHVILIANYVGEQLSW